MAVSHAPPSFRGERAGYLFKIIVALTKSLQSCIGRSNFATLRRLPLAGSTCQFRPQGRNLVSLTLVTFFELADLVLRIEQLFLQLFVRDRAGFSPCSSEEVCSISRNLQTAARRQRQA
jgi:hypothetical protein